MPIADLMAGYPAFDSVADRFALAESLGVRGIAIWSLGSEDPANWAVLTQGCRLDVDADGEFRVNDILAVAAWGGVAGDLVYRAHLDLDADGDVDGTDVQRAAAGWRVGCQTDHQLLLWLQPPSSSSPLLRAGTRGIIILNPGYRIIE